MVIDVVADVNQTVRCDRLRTTIAPLEYAIHIRAVSAVSYLLSRGANTPPVAVWPTHTNMYKAIREQKMKDKGVDLPSAKVFRSMSAAERVAL